MKTRLDQQYWTLSYGSGGESVTAWLTAPAQATQVSPAYWLPSGRFLTFELPDLPYLMINVACDIAAFIIKLPFCVFYSGTSKLT